MAFLLIYLYLSIRPISSISENQAIMSLAFENISESIFQSNGRVALRNFGSGLDIIDSLINSLKRNSIPYSMKQEEIISTTNKSYEVNGSEILTFDSVNSFQQFNEMVKLTNDFPNDIHIFILCENARDQEIASIKVSSDLLTHILQYEYFIIEEAEVIRLLTFVWYTPKSCRKLQLVEVNRFDKKSRKWMGSDFVLNKFENFHRCPLVFGLIQHRIFNNFHIIDNSTIIYSGFFIRIFKELQENLNFTFDVNAKVRDTDTGIELLKELPVDYFIENGCYNFFFKESETIFNTSRSMTRSFSFLRTQMALPPGEKHTGYEKFVLCFDKLTWILIIVTFVVAFSTIFIVNFSSDLVKNIVFERVITSPALNVARIFSGVSQVTTPRRTFARILTVLFILYSLIIRTSWQGKMFEFLQKNMTKPGVRTIDEMIEKTYSFYVTEAFLYLYKNTDLARR